jgi:uncharacterized OB-fold protein
MREQESYDAYMRRKAIQADQQDDVRRGPFHKRYGFTCGNCGSVHFTREELQQCRETG